MTKDERDAAFKEYVEANTYPPATRIMKQLLDYIEELEARVRELEHRVSLSLNAFCEIATTSFVCKPGDRCWACCQREQWRRADGAPEDPAK